MQNMTANADLIEISVPATRSDASASSQTNAKACLVKRNPITGEGAVCQEVTDFGRQSNTPRQTRRTLNKDLIVWDPQSTNDKSSKTRTTRDPIALLGDLGIEVDMLNSKHRPGSGKPKNPIRNPINGSGDFGIKEWDPIWKYAGKPNRSNSCGRRGDCSNPVTGKNAKFYVISTEEKERVPANKPKQNRNAITGANCETFVISNELKKIIPNKPHSQRNALTGECCDSYVINVEESKEKKQPKALRKDPLSGENLTSFVISNEEKQRSPRPYVYTNTLTGENRESYKILPFERVIKEGKVFEKASNPLSGENTKSYAFSPSEKKIVSSRRDISSPLTGTGSRGVTYEISIEERRQKPNQPSQPVKHNSHKVPLVQRNIITGDNCETYMVCREMRSENNRPQTAGAELGCRSPLVNRSISCGYNIFTGNAY